MHQFMLAYDEEILKRKKNASIYVIFDPSYFKICPRSYL